MGWHWKQTRWNEYTLTGPNGEVKKFKSYADLYRHCAERKIDAQQV